ncbi:MAG: hypothetical protein M1836_007899 [Candelina mexicana]|nr:MAG: hypothetical protein M1836_007899 [Candelina mexicana]
MSATNENADQAFSTGEPNNALADITNGQPTADGEPDGKPRARPVGWVEPVAYNYDVYNANTPEARIAIENSVDAPAWASGAEKYEWSDEYGDVGPAIPALEAQLFNSDRVMEDRDGLTQLTEFTVTQEGPIQIAPVKKFDDAGLHPVMLQNIRLARYDIPTPVQAYCLPAILKGYDVIACAQTGSGKTAAFLIPTLSKLMGKAKKLAAARPNPARYNPETDAVRAEPLLLVVAPTRELAMQIFDEARRFCYRSMLRPCVVYGGGPAREQRDELQKGCDVLIATPGRLCDFMDKPHVLSLNRVKYTIIDEADEMLNADWEEELKKIMSGGDTNEDADHTFMMFSATFPKAARELAKQYIALDHVRVRIGRAGSTHKNLVQTVSTGRPARVGDPRAKQLQVVFIEEPRKKDALYDLLLSMPPTRTIIFTNTKRQADFLDDFLYNLELPTTSIHADRTQREREDALRAFRTGKAPILITTGVSARGLDIKNVMHVINYDLPTTTYGGIDEYIHRIGRSGRIGNRGTATSFYNDRNEDIAEGLVRILLETKQAVPDFLQGSMPEGGEEAKLDFDDDSDNEGEADAEGGATEAANGVAEATNDANDEEMPSVATQLSDNWTQSANTWTAEPNQAQAVPAW